ncbi:HNH endonuclease [Lactococcus garvieae]|uniref:HNH endonuclease n=1 Tax=Lactococcus garvieae TaxID=1363 RepID=A0A1I4HE86_9LACT|nr:HNH endonuclease [Lactococcus garvieae]SFL39706.1 HNH endonuclease [Lactococcus garvieae]
MEIRQIPDYPNYGVTRDGRVWSYNRNKFMYCYSRKTGSVVFLSYEGIKFMKLVRRLVFETFKGYSPEVITHKDGNVLNNKLDNLIGMSRVELNRRICNRPRKVKPICRLEIVTGKLDIIEVRKKDKDYMKIYQAIRRKSITSGGCFYYYPGEKEELVAEIEAHIRSNNLSLESLRYRDEWSPFIPIIKNHIKKYQKYLKILEEIEDKNYEF